MAIPLTNLHKARVVQQMQTMLLQLQLAMRSNALTHKAMAQAQSPNLETLQAFVGDTALRYISNLQWVIDLRNDPVKKQRFLDVLALMGWAETDITNVVTPLRQAAVALRDAPRTTYAEIITACDALLASVDPLPTLWPE